MEGRIGRITADKAQINLAFAQHLDVGVGSGRGAYIYMDMLRSCFNGFGDGLSGRVHASSSVSCPNGENSDRAVWLFGPAGKGRGIPVKRA